jgi:hypothetical protein
MVSEQAVKGIMAIPLAGWGLFLYGLLVPLNNRYVKAFWWINLGLVGVLHALQLPLAFQAGRKAGVPTSRIVLKTMLYGASWWKPLKMGILRS